MNERPDQHLGTPQGGPVPSLASERVTFARELLDASPVHVTHDVEQVAAAIDACLTSAQVCTACADSDSVEHDLAELGNCIALNQECADVCTITARVLSRPAHCARICRLCAEECARHAHHRHCAICEQACRACVDACSALLAAEALEELEKLEEAGRV
jgi:hypothetical protein